MNIDDPPPSGFYVSFDRNLIDEGFVIKEITTSYWGSWRSPIVILRSIDRSLCGGIYERHPTDLEDFPQGKDKQIGFARVVTDGSTIAYLCDVVISKEYRGKGLGKFLVREFMKNDQVAHLSWLLLTHDAHSFYASMGFKQVTAMKMLPNTKAG